MHFFAMSGMYRFIVRKRKNSSTFSGMSKSNHPHELDGEKSEFMGKVRNWLEF